MKIDRLDINKEILTIHSEIDRLFRHFVDHVIPKALQVDIPAFVPPANVYDHETEIVVELLIPGVKKEDIDLTLRDKVLRIRGIRVERADREYIIHEWTGGDFYREITLPANISENGIRAEYVDGILRITIPKA